MAVYMKAFKNPNKDFQSLLWANQGERPSLPVAVIFKILPELPSDCLKKCILNCFELLNKKEVVLILKQTQSLTFSSLFTILSKECLARKVVSPALCFVFDSRKICFDYHSFDYLFLNPVPYTKLNFLKYHF
ncbi:uncharacterized protein TOL2_C25770 [Desulfobacula toluolica Tol2]|uniref:Uncharacterized protein n=1 Tax=Desulfobacula toluolica (strain DSM 7467 / Tol2) TaxID=651182 RepID=K0NHH2_DESTT|nr:uncharacterized protein TOL2_C25770 [Desulfobacula toluolica Tol2]